ncbi:rhythmically expressed gene 5 protein isoform X1 [Hylaeus volcanicus]|uniref:rhythmically expressed gene 5 protein isoform X1 n=1 Tax=Hylaeus volcanicus TaxID=313075 RepID=UPI0023B7A05E|nr:rhythmically expressed gene 5 protein isoform X1 [Hylaeus volcanicus]
MRNRRTFVIVVGILTLGCRTLCITGSAIPMWEFLSRDEKTSHLFRIFSEQVAKFCTDSSMPDCNKNLLVSGLRSLANMDDTFLDKLDPYQRGAKEMIWRAMAKNGYSPRTGHEPDESYLTTGPDSLATSSTGSETNGLGEDTASSADYARPSAGPYLVGPMVIRVYPDGRPVPEDSTRPLPRDEDIDEYRHSRLPSIDELEAASSTMYDNRSKPNTFPEPNNQPGSRSRSRSQPRPQRQRLNQRSVHLPFETRLLQEVVATRNIRYY